MQFFNIILFNQITSLFKKINKFKILELALEQCHFGFIMIMPIFTIVLKDFHKLFLEAIFKYGSVTISRILCKIVVVEILVLFIAYFDLNGIISNRYSLKIKFFIKEHRKVFMFYQNHNEKCDADSKAKENKT